MGERNIDQSIGFGVTRNTYSAHSKFSENTQAEKVVDRTGKPVGENSSNAETARANAARGCGVYRHRHVNNKGHGAPSRTTWRKTGTMHTLEMSPGLPV